MSSSAIHTPADKVTCRLCGRQFAKYYCPTCNVPYCSLTCFRSETHSQCSETFYKKEVELKIQSEPSKTPQERLKMMELLKKFEEENRQTGKSADDSDDEDDSEDLLRRFEDVDLDTAPVVDLWSKLTPDEQARFLKVMEDPSSGVARQLLASTDLEKQKREPWWEAPAVELDDEDVQPHVHTWFGSRPNAMHIPVAMVKPIPTGQPLLYNIVAVCIAYAYVTRHFSVSPLSSLTPDNPDFIESRRLISQLVPFVTDRKSTMLHSNLASLTTDMWSRFEPGQMNPELFAFLLRDAARLVRPLPVTPLSTHQSPLADVDLNSHPHRDLILVLSDITKLFEASPAPTKPNSQFKHVTHKLLFYAAHILSTPPSVLRALAEQLIETSAAYQKQVLGTTLDAVPVPLAERKNPGPRAGIVEEIGG